MRPGRKPRDQDTTEFTAPVPGMPDLNLSWRSGRPYHDDGQRYRVYHNKQKRALFNYTQPGGTHIVAPLLQLVQATFHGGITWAYFTQDDVTDGDPSNHAPHNLPDLTLANEHWRPVPPYPDHPAFAYPYEASDAGRIAYLRGDIRYLLHPNPKGNGYIQVRLRLATSETRPFALSHLICRAWVGLPPQDGLAWDVDHIDLDPQNNTPQNLQYLDLRGNRGHDYRDQRELIPERLTMSQIPRNVQQEILRRISECTPESRLATVRELLDAHNLERASLIGWLQRHNPDRPARDHRPPSQQLEAQALALHHDGQAVAQITNATGLSRATIRKILARAGHNPASASH